MVGVVALAVVAVEEVDQGLEDESLIDVVVAMIKGEQKMLLILSIYLQPIHDQERIIVAHMAVLLCTFLEICTSNKWF